MFTINFTKEYSKDFDEKGYWLLELYVEANSIKKVTSKVISDFIKLMEEASKKTVDANEGFEIEPDALISATEAKVKRELK